MSAASRYHQLLTERQSVLDNAREASRLTIPGLIPEEGQNSHTVYVQPYQSLGARGVNNLASKLLLSQFPPERPIFRLAIDEETAAELGQSLGEVQNKLAAIARKAMLLVDTSLARPIWMLVYRHLIVAGNALVFHPVDGSKPQLWRIDQYVVRRSPQGELLEIVIREQVAPSTLSEEVRTACQVAPDEDQDEKDRGEKPIELFTHVRRVGKKIESHQEINDIVVPGSKGTAPADSSGWQALRWQEVPGSDYGRGHVTEYIGDFLSLEDATKAILQFAAAASRIVGIVDPNSGIDVEELAGAESGDYLTGFADKITQLQLDKNQDFQVVFKVSETLRQELAEAFLLTANTIRDAERVTAEEIRAVAQELEDALGGTYTVLSAEVHLPYVSRLLYILNRKGLAPKLPDSVHPSIITGFAALGSNHALNALRSWLADLSATLGPGWVQQNIDGTEYARRSAEGWGIEGVDSLLLSDADKQAMMQNSVAAQAGIAAAPQFAKGAMDAANKGTTQ